MQVISNTHTVSQSKCALQKFISVINTFNYCLLFFCFQVKVVILGQDPYHDDGQVRMKACTNLQYIPESQQTILNICQFRADPLKIIFQRGIQLSGRDGFRPPPPPPFIKKKIMKPSYYHSKQFSALQPPPPPHQHTEKK